MGNLERSRKMCFYYPTPYCRFKVKDARSLVVEVSSYFANLSSTVIEPALQINIPLRVTMNMFKLNVRNILPEVFCGKGELTQNFTKFTGKHLYQSLFFDKVAGRRLAT